LKIRAYSKNDKQAVLELLKSNTPKYFDPSEEKDFISYLEDEIEDYFVVEKNNLIIGSGGINYFYIEKVARISWDMISSKAQCRGIGKRLLLHRIDRIKQNPLIDHIVVRTSQHAYRFYEKLGFGVEKIEKNFWAKDFDLYLMQMVTHT